MKFFTKIFIVNIIVVILVQGISVHSQTADTMATQTTQCILQYIDNLSSQPNNKVISGQMMDRRNFGPYNVQTEFDTAITAVYNLTNKWVGIIGTDYKRSFWPATDQTKEILNTNIPLISHFKNGGLVTIMSQINNPWNGMDANNTVGADNLLDLMNPSTSAYTNFHMDLDSIAYGLQQLQDSGVTVLYRPFHENNGVWFWWGYKPSHSVSDFQTLWRYLFDYFTQTKNLHNLLWVFSPTAKPTGSGMHDELYYYPGDNYVDIVAVDIYRDTLDLVNYASLVATGKPLAIAEFGPHDSSPIQGSYDYTILINQIKNKYPEFRYWMSWNHFTAPGGNRYYSLSRQANTDLLLNDPWVVTRDEINYGNCSQTTNIMNEYYSDELIIYPTPTADVLNFSMELEKVEVYNAYGQLVLTNVLNAKSISVENLANGIYFLKSGNINKKFIVKH
jgi:mannan endo-1,4-beta-mannosidase